MHGSEVPDLLLHYLPGEDFDAGRRIQGFSRNRYPVAPKP